MYHIIISYIKFLLTSTNQHNIHSPFVYKFTTSCLYRLSHKFDIDFKQFRMSLISNKSILQVVDYGAGSRRFKNNMRPISEISKNAGISNRRGKLLFQIVQYFKPKNILEIGTSLGLSTYCLSKGHPAAQVISLEGCPNTAKIAKQQLKKFDCNNVKIIIGEFNKTLHDPLKTKSFDLIFFDGNHQKKATISYFEQALKNINNKSVFIFDDIHWNKEMEMAWSYIKNHEKVTISIDTFQWGIVFFRKEQVKEHFTIRI